MNDDELEARLRDWGADQRASAAPLDVRVPGRLRRRGALWPAAAVAAVVLAIGAVIAGVKLAGSSTRTPATRAPLAAGTAAAPPPAPAGTRWVVFHGLAVAVPADWPVNDIRCGVPVADTVVLPAPQAACGSSQRPTATTVEFTGGTTAVDTTYWHDVRVQSFDVAGAAATRTTGVDDLRHAVAVRVPSLAASVRIESRSAATAARLAGTLTILAADENRCPAHSDATDRLPTGGAPGRPGAETQLLPGAPGRVSVCRYVAGYLEQSAGLAGVAARSLAGLLNSLPAGLSRANPADFLPSLCRKPGSTGYPDDTSDAEGFLIMARYASGPDVDVIVRLGLCGDLGASNGAVTGQFTQPLAEQLTRIAGYSGGWPGDVRPK